MGHVRYFDITRGELIYCLLYISPWYSYHPIIKKNIWKCHCNCNPLSWWLYQPTISSQQSIHMFVGHFFACITIMSPLYPHWMSNLPQCLYYICICLQLFAYFFLTHYAICFPHIRVVYIRTYITIISICSHYTILTTS